jgi:hypothetical protein
MRPEFCFVVVFLDVDVRWFARNSFIGIEEESELAMAEDGRLLTILTHVTRSGVKSRDMLYGVSRYILYILWVGFCSSIQCSTMVARGIEGSISRTRVEQ